MKLLLAAAASAVVLAAPLALTTTSAHAAAPTLSRAGCATRADYSHIHKGMTKAKVDARLHSHGHRKAHASSGGFSTAIYSYKTCSQFSALSVAFDKHGHGPWKLSAKSAVWA
jgi:hypothetical protein